MATCPKCGNYFRVMEDEDPCSFNCRKCGFDPEWHETPDVEIDEEDE